jgi:hypothetical protein
MRWAILFVLGVWLFAAAGSQPARAQIGIDLPFGDSGGGLWIGPGGGGPSKNAPGGKPAVGPPGGKFGETKPALPLKSPQFKPETPKPPTGDLAKTPHKLDLGKTPPPPAGPRKDLAGDKPLGPKGPSDAKTTDKPVGDGKTTDKPDTGVTFDGGPVDPRIKVEGSGGAIVIDSTPPSRPVTYVAPLPNALCGPDVTEEVLAILRDMAHQFRANPDKQGAACRKLVNPLTGNQAWDINGLDPTTGGAAGHYQGSESTTDDASAWLADKLAGTPLAPYGPARRKWVPPQPGTWLTGVSDACAVPRPDPVCAATVEFLGTCQHAQVVNYAMWGMVTGLCDESGVGATHALGESERSARNFAKRWGTPPDQELMVKVGERYHDLTRGAGDGPPPDTEELANWLQFEDERASHPERACPLHCPLTDAQKRRLKVYLNGFDWDGLTR